jgi:hypothetical protein
MANRSNNTSRETDRAEDSVIDSEVPPDFICMGGLQNHLKVLEVV